MNELTIQEIADRANIDKTAAYALVQFLSKAGLVNKGSGRKPAGKGKAVATYLMAETMPKAVNEVLCKLTASDGSQDKKAAPEDHTFDDGTDEDEESDDGDGDDMTQASDQDDDEKA